MLSNLPGVTQEVCDRAGQKPRWSDPLGPSFPQRLKTQWEKKKVRTKVPKAGMLKEG